MLQELFPEAESDDARVSRQKKGSVLEMIGRWNKDVRRQPVVHQTRFETDMNSESLQVAWKHGTDVPTMIHSYELLDNTSYAPIGRIALYADLLNLRAAKRLLRRHLSEVRIIGRCVDCLYFHPPDDWSGATEEAPEAAETLPTGDSRFRVRRVENPQSKVPRTPRLLEPRDCVEHLDSWRWTVVHEDERETLCAAMD